MLYIYAVCKYPGLLVGWRTGAGWALSTSPPRSFDLASLWLVWRFPDMHSWFSRQPAAFDEKGGPRDVASPAGATALKPSTPILSSPPRASPTRLQVQRRIWK